MNPSSSAIDWFVLRSVHDTRNIFYSIYFQMHLCVLLGFCSGPTFHIRMWPLEICMSVLFVTSFC